jgi:hypothetical protein
MKTINSPADMADRRANYAIHVDGSFWRWAGTLEQFEKDCAEYVSGSIGAWKRLSRRGLLWKDEFGQCLMVAVPIRELRGVQS